MMIHRVRVLPTPPPTRTVVMRNSKLGEAVVIPSIPQPHPDVFRCQQPSSLPSSSHHSMMHHLSFILFLIFTLIQLPLITSAISTPSSSSSTAGFSYSNTTDASITDAQILNSLPVSNLVALIIVCVLIFTVCLCLFICARSQIKGSGHLTDANGAGGRGKDPRLLAKIEQARKSWRDAKSSEDGTSPDDGTGGAAPLTLLQQYPSASLAFLRTHGASILEITSRSLEIQKYEMSYIRGGSISNLGILRYHHFRDPEDFINEVWASEATREILKNSGCQLDVVLQAQLCQYLSGLSAFIPGCIVVLLPFHAMLLPLMKMTDWYGEIQHLDFMTCMIVAGSGLFLHILSWYIARMICEYDRTPSLIRERQEWKTRQQMLLMREQQLGLINGMAGGGGGGGGGKPTWLASPKNTGGGFAGVMPSPMTGGKGGGGGGAKFNFPNTGGGVSMSPTSPSNTNGATITTSTAPPTTLVTSPRAGGGVTLPTTAASIDPSMYDFIGAEPSLWPLRFFCFVALLAYAALGYQAYISCDESGGRQYGITSTSSKYWPPTHGEAPAITFLICCIVGGAAMIPLGLCVKLLALFHPRKVHAHSL